MVGLCLHRASVPAEDNECVDSELSPATIWDLYPLSSLLSLLFSEGLRDGS